MLWSLQQCLSRGDPYTGHVHIKSQTLLLQPVTHLILWPAGKGSINITKTKTMGNRNNNKHKALLEHIFSLLLLQKLITSKVFGTWNSTQIYHYQVWLHRVYAQTHVWTRWRSRDQPSLGPAVARTPPLLNSAGGRLSSKLNVVDWLLFNLMKKEIEFIPRICWVKLVSKKWPKLRTLCTYFPKSFLIPLDFFAFSGVVGSVWVLSLLLDLCGSPARSRWSVPLCSVSAKQTHCHNLL